MCFFNTNRSFIAYHLTFSTIQPGKLPIIHCGCILLAQQVFLIYSLFLNKSLFVSSCAVGYVVFPMFLCFIQKACFLETYVIALTVLFVLISCLTWSFLLSFVILDILIDDPIAFIHKGNMLEIQSNLRPLAFGLIMVSTPIASSSFTCMERFACNRRYVPVFKSVRLFSLASTCF